MNNIQKNILNELRKESQKLGYSPRRREIPKLAHQCYRHFNSFNKAKKKAGLELTHHRVVDFPKKAFKLDKDLAILIAYLTADGHLYKDLKGFHFYSNDLKMLKELEKIINNKFGLKGIYGKGSGYGTCFRYKVFNKIVTLFLRDTGVPAGDKMLISFDVPKWIKKNKEFSKEYLKIIFYCEGSKYKHSKNTEAIRINFNKSEKLLDDCVHFMNSLKEMLKTFKIETTNIWIMEGNLRKRDGERTKMVAFKIKSVDINKFINKIGWLK